MAEFSHLLVRIRRILSQSPNQKNNLEACKELCCYLKISGNAIIPLFSTEKKSEIDNCRNFKELFDIVSQHLSWMEHSPLDEIIDECDSNDAVKEFNQYKKKLGACQALEIISSAESDPPKGFERACVVINQPYKRLTVEDYERIKSFIFANLDVYRYVTTGYIRVLFDSLHLGWHVTMQAIPHMIKMAHKQQSLFTKKCYVFMQIGKEIIINMHTEQPLVNLVSLHVCSLLKYIASYVCSN